MQEQQLKDRTKKFALRIMKLFEALPKTTIAYTIGKQLLRSGMSVGANYRAACRGRSKADFASKLGIAVEEADECEYWLELLVDGEILPAERLEPLRKESAELTAIFVSSVKTTKLGRPQQESKEPDENRNQVESRPQSEEKN
ncbi:MAG: four helix bundle protein [Planctomycetes bacterium]|nr:four helix bundle protein [Planctomycetota bacterium]